MRFIDQVNIGDIIKWQENNNNYYWAKVLRKTKSMVFTEYGYRFTANGRIIGRNCYASLATEEGIKEIKIKQKRINFVGFLQNLTDDEFIQVYSFAVNLHLDREES